MDIQPSITIEPVPELNVMLSWNFMWKHYKQDAVYMPPAPLVAIPKTIGVTNGKHDH